MTNNAMIITLAYPETIVRISDEWFLNYLHFFGIGKKNYVRAGHAALVLIHKNTASLEYFDFGRYISPLSTGRVRSKETDHELDFPLQPIIKDGMIENLDQLLVFLAAHPKLTHGEGNMYASVCYEVNYESTKSFISSMQDKQFIRYAAFKKNATNCARFVTDALIAGVTNPFIKNKLIKSNRFTPSTIGNVIIANSWKQVFKVSENGEIDVFKSSTNNLNRAMFLDQLKNHQPNLMGNLEPKHNAIRHKKAQWIPGIGGGAWFELYDLKHDIEYRFRRVSPYGNIDVDGVYQLKEKGFDINSNYEFTHSSNCKVLNVKQSDRIYRFEFLRKHD